MNSFNVSSHSTSGFWTRKGLLLLLLFALLAAGCGGGEESPGDEPAESESRAGGLATMPAARFNQPTTAITPGSSQNSGAAAESTQLIERGATIYTNQGCDDCHGSAGEGVADKGSALTDIEIDQSSFENVLRTASAGALGAEHIFGPTAISPSGVEALYTYVQSLGAE